MSTKITYKYNGQEYTTAYQVRKAIADAERKAFGNPQTPEEWEALGVVKTVEEVEDVVPEPIVRTNEELAREARDKRDRLLDKSDWYVMPDYPAKAEDLAAVKTYRQNLRDISKQNGFPSDIVWPTKPVVLGDGDAE